MAEAGGDAGGGKEGKKGGRGSQAAGEAKKSRLAALAPGENIKEKQVSKNSSGWWG